MKFVAFERSKQGTGASRRLRNSGRAPGIVYGAGEPPLMIELDHNALWHALRKEAFHSSILEMEVAGKTSKVLLRDVQYHPFRPLVLHVDFQRVNAEEKLRLKVPLHFVGEAESPAVKMDRCLMNYVLSELEVHCLPADLPEFIEVDVSKLEKGAIVRLSDVVLPKGVEIVTHGQEDQVLLSVVAPGGAEEESTAEGAEGAAAPAPSAAEDKK